MSALAVWQIDKGATVPDAATYSPPAPTSSRTVDVSLAAGMSPSEIATRLGASGAIDSATQFRILVAILGYQGSLQAGDYEFRPGTPALDAVYRVRNGVISERSLTVVEGRRLEEVADTVAAQGISSNDFIATARVADFRQETGLNFLADLQSDGNLEGYLFPATYPVRNNDKARDLILRMLQTFGERLPADAAQKASAAGLSLNDVVTLASVIEREAQVASERPIMAQVFLSRLRQGIPLEADPTVQYAIASDAESVQTYGYWKPDLTREDLGIDSPYNTYLNRGLPPGPICNPGLDSIKAVLEPADTSFLYFVAKPDGSHAFASTLEEHQRNIEKYQGQ